jgi:hypothetical protein
MACTGNKASGEQEDGMDAETDSLTADSLAKAEEAAAEVMPMGADELFDDFFFNFASNRKLQLERISFPLTVQGEGKKLTISRSQWKMDAFFMQQDYYTLIFDSEQQMDLVKDTTVSETVVEKIDLQQNQVRQYLFSRASGRWMMTGINDQTLQRNDNAPFLSFYQHFVSDSVFQQQCLANQMEFSGPDPDDDFQQIEGMITPDQWGAFAPEFPQNIIYNIVYGHQHAAATRKILVLRGIANGLEMEVTSKQHRGRWKLTKLVM